VLPGLAALKPAALKPSARWRLLLSPGGVALAGPDQRAQFYPSQHPGWAQSLARAATLLPAANAPATLEILLAGVWGRCVLSPPLNDLPDADETAALAHQTSAEVYGPEALNWHSHGHIQAPGLPLVISTVEPGWLDDLQQFATSRQLTLTSVQPLLAACWQQARRSLPKSAQWFALLEPARAQLIGLQQGRWRSLASARCDSEGGGLRTLLHREAVLAGRPWERGEVWVYATHTTPPPSQNWHWHLLAAPPAQPYANLLDAR
jgi:hypothetical protein